MSVRLARHLRVDESVAEEDLQVVQPLPYGQRPRGRRRHRAFLSRPPARNRLATRSRRDAGRTRTAIGLGMKSPIPAKPESPFATRALSAMNQRVPGLSWQARVKSTDLGLCANAGISAVEILGLTSVFGASQSRARIPDLRKSSQRALFRFAIFGVREPPISPYRNLPRLHRPSLAPLAEASASYEQTVRIDRLP